MSQIIRSKPASALPTWIDPEWKPRSDLELKFAQLWVKLFPEIDLHAEHQFDENRKFRFDFAHILSKTAIEVQGGIWIKGGHSTPKGIQRDYEKLNLAQSLGWRVFLLTAETCEYEAELSAIANVMRENG